MKKNETWSTNIKAGIKSENLKKQPSSKLPKIVSFLKKKDDMARPSCCTEQESTPASTSTPSSTTGDYMFIFNRRLCTAKRPESAPIM